MANKQTGSIHACHAMLCAYVLCTYLYAVTLEQDFDKAVLVMRIVQVRIQRTAIAATAVVYSGVCSIRLVHHE